jgi:hypothetical protein
VGKAPVAIPWHKTPKAIARRRCAYAFTREQKIIAATRWNQSNPERRKATLKRYAQRHAEAERARQRARHHADPKKAIERLKRWAKKARKTNPRFLMKSRLKTRLNHAFKNGLGKKVGSTLVLVGCSWEELRSHIESRFVDGMSWARIREIEIDHIIPCAKFDLTDPEQQRRCFHYTNLQPLWRGDNRAKGAKIAA